MYEERRAESLALLADEPKHARIAEGIEAVRARLESLGAERGDLARWTKLDRSRRALEYALYSAEKDKAEAEIAALSAAMAAEGVGDAAGGGSAELRAQVAQLSSRIGAFKLQVASHTDCITPFSYVVMPSHTRFAPLLAATRSQLRWRRTRSHWMRPSSALKRLSKSAAMHCRVLRPAASRPLPLRPRRGAAPPLTLRRLQRWPRS